MTAREEDSVGRLAWGLRRHRAVAIAIVGLALAASVWSRPPAKYRATALVTAYQLTMNPLQVPRLGQTVFVNGAVADAVIAHEHLAVGRDKVIPAKVSLAPVQDSIIFVVRGTDRSPAVATELANAAAFAFVVQLNKPGAGLGTFGVQEAATVPSTPLGTGRSLATSVLIGGGAGMVLALAVVALLLARRNPVLGLYEAAGLCDAEPLGAVHLTDPRARTNGDHAARGIAPLIRVLSPESGATWTFVPCGGGAEFQATERLRTQVAMQLAATGELTVVASADEAGDEPAPPRAGRKPLVARPRIVVRTECRAPAALDLMHGPGSGDRTVLVVCEGTTTDAVVDIASDFLPQDVTGVVFVQRRRFGKWRRRDERGGRSAPGGMRSGTHPVALAVVPDRSSPAGASVLRSASGR